MISVPDIGADLCVQVSLTPFLGSGLACGLLYQFRSPSYLRDNAKYDDLMICEFNPEEVDFVAVARRVFPLYVDAFTPYRGAVIPQKDLGGEDWDEIVGLCKETGKDVDGRDGIYRISIVNYFDRELCRRAFNLSPEQIADRLKDKVELASLLLDGVLVIVTSEMVDRETLKGIDASLRSALRA